MASIEDRLYAVESKLEIQELAVRYGLAVDDRDVEAILGLFARDSVLKTMAGRVKGHGVDQVVDYFVTHFADLGPTNHFVNGHVIRLEAEGVASGTLLSHAEIIRDGRPMVTAMRYLDRYVREQGTWRFQERVQTYMYFCPVEEYPAALGDRLSIRTTPGAPTEGDWPAWFHTSAS